MGPAYEYDAESFYAPRWWWNNSHSPRPRAAYTELLALVVQKTLRDGVSIVEILVAWWKHLMWQEQGDPTGTESAIR